MSPRDRRVQTHIIRASTLLGAAHDLLGRGDRPRAGRDLEDAKLAIENALAVLDETPVLTIRRELT